MSASTLAFAVAVAAFLAFAGAVVFLAILPMIDRVTAALPG